MTTPRGHLVKKYSSIRLVGSTRSTVYILSCLSCQVFGKEFPSRASRDAAAAKHK